MIFRREGYWTWTPLRKWTKCPSYPCCFQWSAPSLSAPARSPCSASSASSKPRRTGPFPRFANTHPSPSWTTLKKTSWCIPRYGTGYHAWFLSAIWPELGPRCQLFWKSTSFPLSCSPTSWHGNRMLIGFSLFLLPLCFVTFLLGSRILRRCFWWPVSDPVANSSDLRKWLGTSRCNPWPIFPFPTSSYSLWFYWACLFWLGPMTLFSSLS